MIGVKEHTAETRVINQLGGRLRLYGRNESCGP